MDIQLLWYQISLVTFALQYHLFEIIQLKVPKDLHAIVENQQNITRMLESECMPSTDVLFTSFESCTSPRKSKNSKEKQVQTKEAEVIPG